MRLGAILLAALALAGAVLMASHWSTDTSERIVARTPERIVIDNVNVVDVETGALARDRALIIEDGLLAAIEPAGSPIPATRRIDGDGRFAIPGLWDSHVHALGDAEDALDRVLPMFVAYGVTHVRDLGANLSRLVAVRDSLAANPDQIAPRILASGPILVEAELRWYGDLQRAIGEPDAPAEAVADLAEAGVDLLKAYSGLSADSYQALIAAAGERGLPVDGHVPDSVGVVGVIDAGQRSIEHLDISSFLTCAGGPDGPFGDYLTVRFTIGMQAHMRNFANFWDAVDWRTCGAALERFGRRGGALTPTLSLEMRERAMLPEGALDYLTPGARDWCLQDLDEIDAVPAPVRSAAYAALRSALMRVKGAGVTLLAGTDTPNYCIIAGLALSGELELLAGAGLTPLEVLQTATVNPARTFGGQVGLQAGAPADFILLDANPLTDVTAYRAPSGVFTQARWHDREALAALRAGARP